jgi:hypothetical protein
VRESSFSCIVLLSRGSCFLLQTADAISSSAVLSLDVSLGEIGMSKAHFREHFRDYVKTELRTQFDNLNDKQRSVWMARFYADVVIRALNPGLLPESEEDLNACLIDGKDDCGVDFLAREGNTVLIVQAKYSGIKKAGKKGAEKSETFDYFCGVLSRLSAGPSKYAMNQKLKDAIADISWEKDNFLLHYITLHRPAGNSFARSEQPVDALPEYPDIGDRTSLELFDEEKLNLILREAMKLELTPTETIRIMFSPGDEDEPWLCFEDSRTSRKSYIGRISGAQLATLFKQYKSALFTLNIRNYIGDTSTNRAIRRTATSNPSDFFYANNGICAVATRVRPDKADDEGRTLLCDRFSIINGAQTVRSLSKAHSENAAAVRDVQVLLRLVEYDSKVTQAEQTFLDNIIRNNNTQNAIRISDFRSNDQVQISLRQQFAKVPALKGKSFVYRNKRTGERDSLRIIISLEELVKTLHAFWFGPDDMYGGTGYLFNTDRTGGYFKIFGDGAELKTALTSEEFEDIAGTWFLCDYTKNLWKQRPEKLQVPALERRWMIYWAVGESIRVVYGDQLSELKRDVRKLSDPFWLAEQNQKGEHYRTAIRQHYDLAVQVLKKAYAQLEREETFSHRNWFRDESTMKTVRAELDSFSVLTSQLKAQYKLSKTQV